MTRSLRELPRMATAFRHWTAIWDGAGDLDTYLAKRLNRAVAIQDQLDEAFLTIGLSADRVNDLIAAVDQIENVCDHSLKGFYEYTQTSDWTKVTQLQCDICGKRLDW